MALKTVKVQKQMEGLFEKAQVFRPPDSLKRPHLTRNAPL